MQQQQAATMRSPMIICLRQEHHAPIKCGVLGGFLIGVLGVLLPPVMFWGEFEINTLANPKRPLAHIWPQGGVWGTDVFLQGNYGPWMYLLIGLVKLVAISITVLSGQPYFHHLDCPSESHMSLHPGPDSCAVTMLHV